ncbi:MAG: D-glycero-beta-D-manno-heptose 1-phosphate adenylyltransferase [Candidatus Omnitrophota bacterium]|jgi:D-beta-D-heptose 7-phosphate kinase/D-beta-D-heptose 1-phosphate adenosyltransferase
MNASSRSKIIAEKSIQKLFRRLRRAGKKIVFTNGTFDLIHTGHVEYLEAARSAGDLLVVGVNSDRSVKSYKDPSRPLNPLRDRMRVLAALGCVDFVTPFDTPTPLALILKVRPHVLAKGADWKKSQIVGAREVESWGGKVRRIRLVPGRSTTRLVNLLGGKGKS